MGKFSRTSGTTPDGHAAAFEQAYGPQTCRVRNGQSESAADLAAARRPSSKGPKLKSSPRPDLRALVDAARAAERLLGGRLRNVDAECAAVASRLRSVLRELGF
jgi:hypothetical protein